MEENQKPLSTVHEVLQNAVFASKSPPGRPISVRVDEELRVAAQAICESNGTTLSEYLRQSLVSLVGDYVDPARG
jgi:hypothetical protein